jgi:hypothetical protein
MSILFFSLRGVPEDEAEDIRELLCNNDIEFYETNPGLWGISPPAIWLYHQEDMQKIRPLFDEYQRQRAIIQRQRYLQLKQQGEIQGFLAHNFHKPIRFLIYITTIALIVYISIKWLFEMGL